jgi:hypothetical protein
MLLVVVIPDSPSSIVVLWCRLIQATAEAHLLVHTINRNQEMHYITVHTRF